MIISTDSVCTYLIKWFLWKLLNCYPVQTLFLMITSFWRRWSSCWLGETIGYSWIVTVIIKKSYILRWHLFPVQILVYCFYIYWVCGIPILTVQGRVFIGIVNAIMLRSWRNFFIFSFCWISSVSVLSGIGVNTMLLAYSASTMMCGGRMGWRIRRWCRWLKSCSFSSVLAPSFSYLQVISYVCVIKINTWYDGRHQSDLEFFFINHTFSKGCGD